MKHLGIAILLVASFCCAQAPDEFQPSSTNVWGAQYPRVDTNGRVQIRVKAPDVTKVKLNSWSGPKIEFGRIDQARLAAELGSARRYLNIGVKLLWIPSGCGNRAR